jgi:uncharacterized protein YgbK (DUF1537 family)
MLLGCIADDSTGASDLANTLVKAGMRTVQFIGVPSGNVQDCDAGVVSLKSRSIPAKDAIEQSLAALQWLRAQGCKQFVFKYCSTFDSTPEGNIGPVAQALAKELGAKRVVVCPVFPEAGRTVYQGHLFVHDKLLSESGMEKHPLNPMTDPDIRRWLRLQTSLKVGHVGYGAVRRGAKAIADAIAAQEEGLIVVDALTDDDLVAIGTACDGAPLVSGGSGIAMGLPDNFRRQGLLRKASQGFSGVVGPGAVLAGSCSSATLGQIKKYASDHPAQAVGVDDVMDGRVSADALAKFMIDNLGKKPLVYSSATPEDVAASQKKHGRDAVAHKLDALFGDVARKLVGAGVKRLVVAGGETSGAVVSALGIRAFEVGPEIDPGVPALRTDSTPSLGLALKSGNFGAPDFFDKALRALGGEG